MPRKTAPAEGRRWLEEIDEGKTEASIARRDRRDLRTVRRAVEAARRERDLGAVRREALKEAFLRHHSQLLAALGGLRSVVTAPPAEPHIPPLGTSPPGRFPIPGGAVLARDSGGFEVRLDMDGDLMLRLLAEHLPGDPLWTQVEAWRRSNVALVAAHLALGKEVKTHLIGCTDLRIAGTPQPDGHVTLEGAQLIYRLAVRQAIQGGDHLSASQSAPRQEGDEVRMFADGVDWLLGRGAMVRESVARTMRELAASPRLATLKSTRDLVVAAGAAAEETMALYGATGYIPGRCRACDRLRL